MTRLTITRDPHGVYAILWTLWLGNVIGALAANEHPAYGLVVLLCFLPIEFSAVFAWNGGSRDTLSEIVTWIAFTLGKSRVVYRGWNAFVVGFIIAPILTLLHRTVVVYGDSSVLAWVFTVSGLVWLADHWLNPQEFG